MKTPEEIKKKEIDGFKIIAGAIAAVIAVCLIGVLIHGAHEGQKADAISKAEKGYRLVELSRGEVENIDAVAIHGFVYYPADATDIDIKTSGKGLDACLTYATGFRQAILVAYETQRGAHFRTSFLNHMPDPEFCNLQKNSEAENAILTEKNLKEAKRKAAIERKNEEKFEAAVLLEVERREREARKERREAEAADDQRITIEDDVFSTPLSTVK